MAGREQSRERATRSARKSVRSRNNTRIQKFTNSARTYKSINVFCTQQEWTTLRENFRLIPDVGRDPKTGEVNEFRDTYTNIQPRNPSIAAVEVDGFLFDIRRGDLIGIDNLRIPQEELMEAACVSEEEFEKVVYRYADWFLQNDQKVPLAFCTYVKLKVELFETTLPPRAPVIHCYAGPQIVKKIFQTIPDYVPDDKFLDLNNRAQCWVAKTMIERGFVQTTHCEVGPDHCFLPGETVYFRNNRVRFERPVWVVSEDEREAFERLREYSRKNRKNASDNDSDEDYRDDFLVKKSLKRGDRFVLVPAYNRGEDNTIEEEELPESILDGGQGGAISKTTEELFALSDRRKVVLKTRDGKYVYVESSDRPTSPTKTKTRRVLRARSTKQLLSSKFSEISNEDGSISLQSMEGKFVVVDPGGVSQVWQWLHGVHRGAIHLPKGIPLRLLLLDRGEPAARNRWCPIANRTWRGRAMAHGRQVLRENGEAALVSHFMDLRGSLGFNAVGLLHGRIEQRDITDYWVECPLNRQSVMTPTSRLLFLDRWRDEHEQKAFRRVVENIQRADFCKEVTVGKTMQ
eukprot:CAMPEP_0179105544 /NCGR_PEP_ID=MMETSP0796-20121207/49023_1 /TAXON_ID=73915 /ORGANISM="Pyrodinium bahamense, Strain pbaha01" /LENGTH=573 /DNA_ID=CAMNT_0020803535 /DNA_START=73 /DNA_END=1795 /DNA_ORIENTATION=+